MDLEGICKELYILGCEIRKDEYLKNHTSFRIGGKTPYMFFPKTKNVFVETLILLKRNNIPFKIIGGGTNLIVTDYDVDFVVLSTKYLTGIKEEFLSDRQKLLVETECGVYLASLSYLVSERGYSGLEFACGIPGTVGGALYMNAGAYDGEIKNIVLEAEVFDLSDMKVKKFRNEELEFSYRKSIFQDSPLILLSSKQVFNKGNVYEIKRKIEEFSSKRLNKQPIEMPCAGSIFKRPKPDFYVGTAIESLGLKGYSIGDAQISSKHAGFIINKGNATFNQVMALIDYVKKTIKETYQVDLIVEPEIWK